MSKLFLGALIFIIPVILQAQYPFRDANLKWGVIETNLHLLSPAEYDTISLYKNGYTIAVRDGKARHLNEAGQALYSPQYDSVGYFDYNHINSGYQGLAVAKKAGNYGLISPSGKPALEYPLIYDKIQLETPGELADYQDPLIFIYQKDGKYGCKINGQQIGKPKYDTIYINFGNPEHLFFKKKKKEYFLTDNGKIEKVKGTEFTFWAVGDALYFIQEMLEIVEKNDRKGLRNMETGQMEIPAIYQDIRYIETEGFITITTDGKHGLVDNLGKRVLADVYKHITQAPEGLLLVEEFSGRMGYLVNGILLLPK